MQRLCGDIHDILWVQRGGSGSKSGRSTRKDFRDEVMFKAISDGVKIHEKIPLYPPEKCSILQDPREEEIV